MLKSIHKALFSSITLNNIIEYTVECNPENVTNELIKTIASIGCNRISLGIQSFDPKVLKICNRNQSLDNAYNALELFNKERFNISIDLINGLPLSNPLEETENLNKAIDKYKNINHISLYELSIDKPSKFYENKKLKLPKESNKEKYEKYSDKIMKKYNFKKYEISNYAKKGFESRHNLNYWEYKNYVGLGPSAHSTVDKLRLENKPDIDMYINGNDYKKVYTLSKKEQMEEYLLMGLRLTAGLNLEDFNARFCVSFKNLFGNTLDKYKEYFIINSNNIRLDNRGLDILNKILIDLFCDVESNIYS